MEIFNLEFQQNLTSFIPGKRLDLNLFYPLILFVLIFHTFLKSEGYNNPYIILTYYSISIITLLYLTIMSYEFEFTNNMRNTIHVNNLTDHIGYLYSACIGGLSLTCLQDFTTNIIKVTLIAILIYIYRMDNFNLVIKS